MGLRMKNFNINPIFRAKGREFRDGVCQKPICRGHCLKRGELGQFADLRGGLSEKRGYSITKKNLQHNVIIILHASCIFVYVNPVISRLDVFTIKKLKKKKKKRIHLN